ncbi:MAG: hypothetical protein KAI43_12140 [Candidatus Aureabacteria bacterium]|nr:hypothetical protein [Candidatus Auribacterota bacterium]
MKKRNFTLFFFITVLFLTMFFNKAFADNVPKRLIHTLNQDILEHLDVSRVTNVTKDFQLQDYSYPSIDIWQWMDWKEKSISIFHIEINTKNYELVISKKNEQLLSEISSYSIKSSNQVLQFMLFEETPFQNILLKDSVLLERIIKTKELKSYLAAIRFGYGKAGQTLYDRMLHKGRSLAGNYTLAALVENIQYYEDPYDEDMIVHFMNVPIMRYTPPGINKGGEDFYFYIDDIESLNTFKKFSVKSTDPFINNRVTRQIDIFLKSLKKSKLPAPDVLYKQVSKIVKQRSKAVNFTFIEQEMSLELGGIIKRYFHSNGIYSVDLFKKNDEVIFRVANKFFILGTTYYYRNWADISQGLEEINDRLTKKTPIKVKVFACSTGEEVITYALHLLEMGVKDFYLLGSDINPNYVKKASSFRYLEERIERLPDEKRQLIFKYFERDGEGFLIPKDIQFFKERVHYMVQDITSTLPKLDKKFSPPYDIVNIQNVLNYIDTAAILKSIEYWLALVDTGGLLVLRDRLYSPYFFKRSSLFRQFVVLNESCAVKIFKKDNVNGLIEEYKNRINKDHDLFAYLCLTSLLESREEWDETYALLEEALVHYRNSYEILSCMGRIAYKAGKYDISKDYLMEAYEIFPVSVNIITLMQKMANHKKDKIGSKYLKALSDANRYYILNQRGGDPQEQIKRYREASALEGSDHLVYLSVAFVSLNIAENFIKEDKKEDAQSYCWASLEFINRALKQKQTPSVFLLSARAYSNIARIFSEQGNFERAEFYINKAVEDFTKSLKKEHFISFYDFGKLHLLWGDVYYQKGDKKMAKKKYFEAVKFFDKAETFLFEKRGYYLYYLLVETSKSYYNIALSEDDNEKAQENFKKAYEYIEQALMLKAVYGIKAENLRKKIREKL